MGDPLPERFGAAVAGRDLFAERLDRGARVSVLPRLRLHPLVEREPLEERQLVGSVLRLGSALLRGFGNRRRTQLDSIRAGAFGDERNRPLDARRPAEVSEARPVRRENRREYQDAALIDGADKVVAGVERDGEFVAGARRDRAGDRLADLQGVLRGYVIGAEQEYC